MVSALLAARRRLIRSRGRPMELQRLVKGSSAIERRVTLLGVPHAFALDQVAAGVQQGDQQVETLDDELQAAAWPGHPKEPDKLLLDGRISTVKDAAAVYDGSLRIGWRLWIRGGT